MRECKLPVDWPVAGLAGRLVNRHAESSESLQLLRIQLAQFGQGMPEDFSRYRWLNIGGLGLDRLVAYRGKFAQLVGHATELAAHPQPAGLAGILRPECTR